MPIYEYFCKKCGKINEFIEIISSDKKFKCQFCGSEELQKIVSKPSFLKNFGEKGKTCCGRDERCDTPPCSSDGFCRR